MISTDSTHVFLLEHQLGPGMPRKILWKERCSEAVIMMCYVQMHNSRKFGAVHVTQKPFECAQT